MVVAPGRALGKDCQAVGCLLGQGFGNQHLQCPGLVDRNNRYLLGQPGLGLKVHPSSACQGFIELDLKTAIPDSKNVPHSCSLVYQPRQSSHSAGQYRQLIPVPVPLGICENQRSFGAAPPEMFHPVDGFLYHRIRQVPKRISLALLGGPRVHLEYF